MGMVGFHWEDKKLSLIMNRNNWTSRVISRAALVGGILGARCGETSGTWFGVYEHRRVAFLVDPSLSDKSIFANGADIIPNEFLTTILSPEMFAVQLAEKEKERHEKRLKKIVDLNNNNINTDDDDTDEDDIDIEYERTYKLVVADLTSGSMVYICKPDKSNPLIHSQQVASGVHTLSLKGLDSDFPKDLSLRNLVNELISQNGNQQTPKQWDELGEKFMYDPTEYVENMDQPDNDSYTTTSRTTFTMNDPMKAVFHEMYLENDEWVDNDTFIDIVVNIDQAFIAEYL